MHARPALFASIRALFPACLGTLALGTLGFAPALGAAQSPLTVQVINDSGHDDWNVFLLLGGQSITLNNGTVLPFSASNIMTVDTSTASPDVTAGRLGCLPPIAPPTPPVPPPGCTAKPVATGQKITSPYSGKMLPVYEFTATTLGSGALYVSYDTAIEYKQAPTIYTRPRWQLFELSYSDQIASVGDLTSIDFFGIPIEVTTFAAGDSTQAKVLNRSTYYSSTETLLKALHGLNPNMGSAMLTTAGTTFTPGTTPIQQFARVVGPNQMAAPGSAMIPTSNPNYSAGSPFPYPSFADYLDSLVNANYTFVEKDNATISAYVFNYTGTISGNRTNGYTITLTGTTAAPLPLPSDATITLNLPPQASANGGFDFNIYGAPQSCDSFAVADFACVTTTTLPTMSNSVYGWIQADVISALNFGYLNGASDAANAQYNNNVAVGNSAAWYGFPPIAYPFGAARVNADGYYNPWAAVMYNQSDAYGFAFSDRNGRPSPGVSLPTGGTLRLWLLPDARLDAPLINATSATCTSTAAGSCSVTLQWPAATDATSYTLSVTPPVPASVKDVPSSSALITTHKLSNLDPGTNYTITAVALNSANNTSSTTLTSQVTMPGTPPAWTGGDTTFIGGFNWDPPSYPQLPPVAGPTYGAAGAMLMVGPSSATELTFLPASIGAPGASTLSVRLPNPALATTLASTMVVFLSTVTPMTTPGGDCPGTQISDGQIILPAGTAIPQGGCTISVGIHPTTADVIVAWTSSLQLANGINQPAAYAALNVAGVNAPSVFLAPTSSIVGVPANLQVQLVNPQPSQFITLAGPYSINAPPGVTFTSNPALTTPCPGMTVTPTTITVPGGTQLNPAASCNVGAMVTASVNGNYIIDSPPLTTAIFQGPAVAFGGGVYSYNGGGAYNLTGGSNPSINAGSTVSMPLQISINGTPLWSDNFLLTFVGTAASFKVPLNDPSNPNLLIRDAGSLTVAGTPGTPPYSATPPYQPTVDATFVPVPDKRFAPVTMPVGQGSR